MHFCGKCKKVKFCYYLTFLTGAKHGAVYQTKIFVMKLKFYRVFWIGDHGTGDYNCIDNYKYYYSIIEKRKSKKIRENERKNVNK